MIMFLRYAVRRRGRGRGSGGGEGGFWRDTKVLKIGEENGEWGMVNSECGGR